MDYQHPRALQAVILDWAGTVVDFGSFAPTKIFVEAFASIGIELTLQEARGPMGLGKQDHIRALCNQSAIIERFVVHLDRHPNENDVKTIYERFMPLQIGKVGEYSSIIPGALEAIEAVRKRGMKIGSTSGYPKVVMNRLVPLAAAAGYQPDFVVATDEVRKGRPGPAQALANVIGLALDDVVACVKVDDTPPGILEGRTAGMWTIAVRFSGNFLGLTWEEYCALSPEQLQYERQRIDRLFSSCRPHYLIDTIVELPSIVDDINQRLEQGEKP